MKKLKELIERRKNKMRMQKDSELMSEFQVVERGDNLWLTHNGVAFIKIDEGMPSSVVTKALKDARENAIEFTRL